VNTTHVIFTLQVIVQLYKKRCPRLCDTVYLWRMTYENSGYERLRLTTTLVNGTDQIWRLPVLNELYIKLRLHGTIAVERLSPHDNASKPDR